MKFFAWIFLICLCAPLALQAESRSLATSGQAASAVPMESSGAKIKAPLPGAKDTVEIVRHPDGSLGYLIKLSGSENDRVLTPLEFTELLYQERAGRGWLATIFNVTSPIGLAWVALGLLGQLVFMGRMLVQWLVSESKGQSIVPVAFWWMSLIGASMLLVYFIWRRDIVGILGQGLGWVIYIRNLILIRRSKT